MKYKERLIDDTHAPATAQAIAAIEQQLGCALPEDYKHFLQQCNGGCLDYDIPLQFEDGSTEFLSFSALYSADIAADWESNPFELVQQKQHSDFPASGVLPIARDGGSSVLYLDLRDGYKVVAYVQGLPGWTGKRQQDALVMVAESFDDYLLQLTLSDETIEQHILRFDVNDITAAATLEWFDSAGLAWREKFRQQWNTRVPFLPV